MTFFGEIQENTDNTSSSQNNKPSPGGRLKFFKGKRFEIRT